MTATEQQPKQEDVYKIQFKLTDLEVQFIASELKRREVLIQGIAVKYAESIQHFVAMCATRKNVTFDQDRFVGVTVDPDKKRAFLLISKNKKS